MMFPLPLIVALFLATGSVAVFAADSGRRPLLAVTKPFTTILLFAVTGWPRSRFALVVDIGIAFSLVGDVALLWASKKALLVGLVLFLGAHVSYIVAFVGAATGQVAARPSLWSPLVVAAAVVMIIATGMLLWALWAGAAELRAPLVVYGLALAAMVVSSVAAVRDWPPATGTVVAPSAAVGALLFFVADGSLALTLFRRPIRHAPVLTLGVYWLGQLGIALAARAIR